MNERRTELETEYRQAVYKIFAGENEIVFRVGENSEAVNRLLDEHNANRFAFITADNPRSEKLSAAENELRRAELIKVLNAENYRFLEGCGADENEKWGREASLLIFDMTREKARETARKFGQNAIVCGEKDEKIKLIWCSDERLKMKS